VAPVDPAMPWHDVFEPPQWAAPTEPPPWSVPLDTLDAPGSHGVVYPPPSLVDSPPPPPAWRPPESPIRESVEPGGDQHRIVD
jgi:hypothetical protein